MENKNIVPNGTGKGVVKVLNLSGGYILPRISESSNWKVGLWMKLRIFKRGFNCSVNIKVFRSTHSIAINSTDRKIT